MHELPVVEDVIRVVDGEAKRLHFSHIHRITLVIGELSSVMDESVQMYFELLAENTPCEGASLEFEHVPAKLRCTVCGTEFPHTHGFACPRCGGDGTLIRGTGQELFIRSIDGE